MRGESRRCKGSIEPLLKLPDGALATRRIVLFLVCRCGGGGARRSRAAQKACSSAKLCRLRLTTRRRRGLSFCIATRTSDAEMRYNARLLL